MKVLPVILLSCCSLATNISAAPNDRTTKWVNIEQVKNGTGAGLTQAYTGKGVIVGIIDIGFDLTHPTFYASDGKTYRIKRFVDNEKDADTTTGHAIPLGREYRTEEEILGVQHSADYQSAQHGTHVLGIAAGSGYGTPYQGMAPDADICAVAIDLATDYTANPESPEFKYIFDYADEQAKPCVINYNMGAGYDPKNYNAPEGSYSTDPWHGEVRVNEFKRMVQALHDAGLGVVMDVVYNHTYSLDSNLNRVVPYYYYRFNGLGAPSNGSGCGNETASDRAMFRKYMVDSVTYWATEYRVDGFRFDLMALHDLDTMQAIERAVHAVNPKALLYGEGWTGGTTTLDPNLQADRKNIRRIEATPGAAGGIAVFNDVTRDGLKGSVFDTKAAGYINGSAAAGTANQVLFGLQGGGSGAVSGWSVPDNMVVNYMSSHDNHTLWDKLTLSCPDAADGEKRAMNALGAAAVLLGRGIPFFLAGEELLRSKDGDGNSYRSSDAVNNLDWESLVPGSPQADMRDWYKTLIALRKSCPFLKTAEVSGRLLAGNALEVTWTEGGAAVALALFNPGAAMEWTLPEGTWYARLGGDGPGEDEDDDHELF